MAVTNITVNGNGLQLKSEFGNIVGEQSLAFVQWEQGYNPINHPYSEWLGNPISVYWAGTYSASQKQWNGSFSTDFDSPIYMWTQLVEDSSQVGLWKISDTLPLSGGSLNINLNNANIMSVVGDSTTVSLYTQTLDTWTPTSVPEPSYFSMSAVLLLAVIIYKKYA